MRILLPFLLAAAMLLPGQTSRKAPAKTKPKPAADSAQNAWPLVDLRVQGSRLYSAAAIIAASGLHVGQTVSKSDFEKARDRLIATGAFETVGFEFAPADGRAGYRAVFNVSDIQQVYPYRFEQLPGTDAELRAFLKEREPFFGSQIPGTREVLDRFARDLNEYAAARKFNDKVIGRVTADKPGELVIVFRPSTPAPVIAEVRFSGNQAVPSSVLHNTLAGVAVGVPYSEPRIRELLTTNIRPLYEAKGRLAVRFPKVEAKEAAGGIKGLSLAITVDEGPEYKFGKIALATDRIPQDELQKLVTIKPDTTADFDAVKATQDALKKRYHKAGYMDMTSTVERHLDDQAKTVDVTIRTQAGPRYTMGKLDVQGLDVIGEPAVRKLWGMKEGSPYDDAYPQYFLDRLREENYFDNLGKTRFETKVNPDNHSVDVTLYFSGAAENTDRKGRRQLP